MIYKKRRKKELSLETYIEGIRTNNRMILGRAITLIESTNPKHRVKADQIIQACLPFAGQSLRIGITGTPGVGKSTFIESLGQHIIKEGRKLAVLAVDPSSQISKGSILGDKTRMMHLSTNQNAFIRPSPAGNSLGGVARRTRETIILCEAAGYDTIFVETVGVGQSEIAVHSMTDFFLLLLLPGSGDELQGIKRGIVEMADLVAFNKADGENLQKAKTSQRAYRNALHFFPKKQSQWIPKATVCSALSDIGIVNIWDIIKSYQTFVAKNGFFNLNRQNQGKYWFYESIETGLKNLFYDNENIRAQLTKTENAVLNDEKTPFTAAKELLALFKSQI